MAKKSTGTNTKASKKKKKPIPKKQKQFYEVTPARIKKAERLAKKGLNIRQIGLSFGWSHDTIHKKINSNSDLADAIKRGQEKTIEQVVSSVLKNATGYEYEEQHEEVAVIDGKKRVIRKKIKKYYPGTSTDRLFFLTNRDRDNWKHRNSIEMNASIEHSVGDIKPEHVKQIEDIKKKIVNMDHVTEDD